LAQAQSIVIMFLVVHSIISSTLLGNKTEETYD